MKKALILLLALMLTVVLVACGGGNETSSPATTTTNPSTTTTPNGQVTTSTPATTTQPATTTTQPAVTTTPAVTTAPLYPGVDILNGDWDNAAINSTWNGINACAFEDHHAALDFRIALVINMLETTNGIFETLVLTDPDAVEPDNNQTNWIMNSDYKWVVTIDGKDIEITNFSCLNDKTTGFIRMDLGDWQYSTEVDEYGYHYYDIVLKIYDAGTDEIAFWAYLTDPEWNGPYEFQIPEPIVMVDDENRDPAHIAITPDEMEPLSGPAGFASETYDLLFDGRVQTKLCTTAITEPVIVKFDSIKHIVSYSLVNANDDESYPERTPTNFKIFGSNDGNTWVEIDSQALTETSNVNYAERNFKLSEEVDYQYIKFENTPAADRYQVSEIIFYTTAEYAE